MESVIIAAPFPYDAESRQRLEGVGPVIVGAADILVIDDGSSRVYVLRNDAVYDELEPERLRLNTSAIPTPIFYTIDFSDIALCRRVLEAIADDPQLLVDNHHGVVLPGQEFVRGRSLSASSAANAIGIGGWTTAQLSCAD